VSHPALDVSVDTVAEQVARVEWSASDADFGEVVGVVRAAIREALATHTRVEAWVDPADVTAQRVATFSGLHREGVMRGVTVDGTARDWIVYARLTTDKPVDQPEGFRALLNSFLPRKRAISQMLIRDPDDRVLLCQLTYKKDWDLPGGVVEVGESPQLAVVREVKEELGLDVEAHGLMLTDWLPSWGGWDDAICLVFDGGVHEAAVAERIVRQEREIRSAEFCTLEQVRQRAADYTARRVEAALFGKQPYTESGR
jgi:8-oxo-dGTP pyrophosphatase MutT (NUDIX family)